MSKRNLKKKEYTELPCYIINIKIHSEKENKQELYSEIFHQIFSLKDFFVNLGNKKGLHLKKLEKTEFPKNLLGNEYDNLEYETYEILEGEFIKYKIEDKNDKHYNLISKELKSGDPNAVDKPNAIQIHFYIIPSIHRVFLPTKEKITPLQVELFFKQALLKIFGSENNFNIDIAKSVDEVNKIYEFKSLKKLNLEISYTNDDLGDDAKEFMDTILKESSTDRYTGNFTAKKGKSLNPNSRLIKGGIELSKENGKLIAEGENDYGNKIIINTKNKYEEYLLKIKREINPCLSILQETLKKWRLK